MAYGHQTPIKPRATEYAFLGHLLYSNVALVFGHPPWYYRERKYLSGPGTESRRWNHGCGKRGLSWLRGEDSWLRWTLHCLFALNTFPHRSRRRAGYIKLGLAKQCWLCFFKKKSHLEDLPILQAIPKSIHLRPEIMSVCTVISPNQSSNRQLRARFSFRGKSEMRFRLEQDHPWRYLGEVFTYSFLVEFTMSNSLKMTVNF